MRLFIFEIYHRRTKGAEVKPRLMVNNSLGLLSISVLCGTFELVNHNVYVRLAFRSINIDL